MVFLLLGLDYFAAAQAGSADAQALGCALHLSAYRTQIHIPTPLAHIVSVADPMAKLRPAAAHFANSCHKTEISCDDRKIDYTSSGIPGATAPLRPLMFLIAKHNRL